MFSGFQHRPSPTTVIACLALFFAVAGGSAIALQGRNTVDTGDIKKGAVRTSDIRNNAVTTKKIRNNHVRAADIRNNAVGTGEIRDGQVVPGDLSAEEPFRHIGDAGQPGFGNGGEGDCLWSKLVAPGVDPFNDPAFFKDARGIVHLTGALRAQDGLGGDGACDDLPDSFAFVLPEGYRPAGLSVFPVAGATRDTTDNDAGQLAIAGATDFVIGTTTVPAGTVFLGTGPNDTNLTLDGITFRAAGPGTGLPRRGGADEAGGLLPLGG